MEKGKGKISVRQVMLISILTVYTPAVRFIAGFTAGKAKQAAWLSPLFSFVIYALIIYILNRLLQNYKGYSFMDIIYDVTSKFWGKIIVGFYMIWLTILLSLYVRYYGERLVTTLYPNDKINIFIIAMLILVSIMIRSGIVVIARMSEIFLLIVVLVFITLTSLLIPNINIDYLTPISYLDVIPIIKGSVGTTALIYITYLLFFSNEFTKTKDFLKYGLYTGLFGLTFIILVIAVSVGILGHSFVGRSPLPFLIAVKEVSILKILSGFESIFVGTWILTDFILIIVFTYSIMNMLKSLFNLRDFKPFINIFLVILFCLSWILAANVYELQAFSANFSAQMNIVMQIGVPILVFLIAKVRKKI